MIRENQDIEQERNLNEKVLAAFHTFYHYRSMGYHCQCNHVIQSRDQHTESVSIYHNGHIEGSFSIQFKLRTMHGKVSKNGSHSRIKEELFKLKKGRMDILHLSLQKYNLSFSFSKSLGEMLIHSLCTLNWQAQQSKQFIYFFSKHSFLHFLQGCRLVSNWVVLSQFG